jgi:lambda family phage portal protein
MTRLTRALAAFLAPAPAPQRRSWDAAGGGRRWKDAPTTPAPVTGGLAAAATLRARARYAYENNPHARAACEVLAAALVGSGIKAVSDRPGIAEAFERWADSADATGMSDFQGVQYLAALAMVRDGECFARQETDDEGRTTVRLIPAEQVDASLHRDLGDGARIVAGVELDGRGRRVAYHILPESPDLPFATAITPVRVPAEDVLHLFRPTYPGQVRGLSWLAPVLVPLSELDKAMDAQIVRQQIGAMLAGFVTDQEGGAGGFEGDQSGSVLDGGLEPGTVKVLGPGQDVKFSDPPAIGAEANEFMRIVLRAVAAGVGVTFEQLTGDYSGSNYSSARAALIEFRRRIEAIQHHVIIRQFCRPVWQRWLATEALAGRIDAAGLAEDPDAFLAARWITPGWGWVDPVKEVQATVAAIDAGLMSRREAVAARGWDVAQLDREIADDAARAPARPRQTMTPPDEREDRE